MSLAKESSEYTVDNTALTLDEKLVSLFQPDTLVSAQYFQNLRRRTILEPEKRVMLAVLEDAVHCFQDNLLAGTVKKKRLFQEAKEWIFETSGDWIFSFVNICEALGLNPQYVRQGLLRWREKMLPKYTEATTWAKRKKAG
ncbi:MAG: hypothetical protein HY695_25020 [Deltaproteobacteria bacterium]|nr:hypothetical protein [Deltaproteobacteria bacterium]